MIEIEHLSKRFGRFLAVDDLGFSVRPGEVLGFLGPNGAGKTTSMRMLAGYLSPDSGTISICGDHMQRAPLRCKQRIGYLPEGAPCYADMPVRGFLRFIAAARGLQRAKAESAVNRVLESLQLSDVVQHPIETLSKGYRRRVGLAQALLHDPGVLILDEPTDGLDPNQKHEVRQLIRQLSSDKIVIISTHILEEVEAVCSRAIIINRGRLVADATPASLKANSEYFRAVELQVADAGALIDALAQLPGVRKVLRSEEAADKLVILSHRDAPIWDEVNALLRDRQIEPLSLSLSPGRLDDVFRRITSPETAAGDRAA